MPRGGARHGAGAKPGAKHRFDKELAKRLAEAGELTPLDIMLAMMNDATLDPEMRLRAAAGAAPYVHRRKPQALEVAGKFEFLTPEERELRRQLLLEEIRAGMARRADPGSN
jgi:hypothetical protein